MRARSILPLLCAAGLLAQKGTEPKPAPRDYPAMAQAGKTGIAAEYMVHSFSGGGRMFVAENYLVVEVAVYPAHGENITISSSQFSLRLNGKKSVLFSQAPGFVAASLKYPDWERRTQMETTAGVGDTGVILGRPGPVGRFPGDPSDRQRLPKPPRAPEPENPSGLPKADAPTADVVVAEAALPEGDFDNPVSGYLYFPYKGKIKSIKSLELVYAGPAGKATLKLP